MKEFPHYRAGILIAQRGGKTREVRSCFDSFSRVRFDARRLSLL